MLETFKVEVAQKSLGHLRLLKIIIYTYLLVKKEVIMVRMVVVAAVGLMLHMEMQHLHSIMHLQ